MKTICEAKILENKNITPAIMDMTILAPEIAKEAKAGQFINMYTGKGEFILPRPISICDFDTEKGTVRAVSAIAICEKFVASNKFNISSSSNKHTGIFNFS